MEHSGLNTFGLQTEHQIRRGIEDDLKISFISQQKYMF